MVQADTVFIVGFIIMLILGALVMGVFYLMGESDIIISIFHGGYEALDSPLAILFSDLLIIIFIPSL